MKLLEIQQTRPDWMIVVTVELKDPSAVEIVDQQIQEIGEPILWIIRATDPLLSPTFTKEFVSYYIVYQVEPQEAAYSLAVGEVIVTHREATRANTIADNIKKIFRRIGRHPQVIGISSQPPHTTHHTHPDSLKLLLQQGAGREYTADVKRVV